MKMITIDPGYNCGIAVWDDNTCIETELIKANGSTDEEKLESLRKQFLFLLRSYPGYNRVIVEGVAMWMGNQSSVISTQRGNTFTLAYVVGVIVACCHQTAKKAELISVTKWKGNMSKQIVHNRIKIATGKKYPEHIADAVGIGLSIKGRL